MTWYLATAMLVDMKGLSISLILLILLSGCASKLPPAISTAPPGDVSISAVRATPGDYMGQTVRWGGEIIKVENRKQYTDISVLARPLNEDGKPHSGGSADARFIARFRGFLEPEEFKTGRLITVSGRFSAIERHKVGEYRYPYPVVEVVEHYRWPRPQTVIVPAYRYNPFLYDPWWPYHPYRYPYYPYWW
jgi:outer membrane lipoprotein